MKVLFAHKHTLGSWLIRAFTWSRWSHVAIVDHDEVIESTLKRGGVRARSLMDFLSEYQHVEMVEWNVPDEAAALRFLRAQIGKPYDWTALVGFLLRRDWAEDDSWFCNELAEAAAQAGGLKRFRGVLSRITPGISWSVI